MGSFTQPGVLMLYQSQAEINTFFVGVIQRVAASPKVAIQDWDMKSTVELLQEIGMLNANVFALLEGFLKGRIQK
jgi:ABC-type thiamin/hydroxymethylpyrimidine transport system permease subunit